jgi:hypothetical protein
MPTYEISFHCNDCGFDHPVLLKIYVEDGPERKQSIAELFHGRSVPPQVAAIRGHTAFCHKTGRRFQLENDEQIFLMPPSSLKPRSLIRYRSPDDA